MNKSFDFEKVGKRMPYKVPQGAFEEMEDRIWQQVKPTLEVRAKRRPGALRIALYSLSAVAAAWALIFWVQFGKPATHPDGMTGVEQAFHNLSADDQAFMLSVYQDDIFINELND